MTSKRTILVLEQSIAVNEKDYISLTDMTKPFGETGLIENWLRNRNTLEFLGLWEQLHNPDFNSLEFEGIKSQSGLNRFTLSAKKWIELTQAIGIHSKAGKYGGTYAHQDIAFEFGAWLSPEFKLYLMKDFQRLKEEENQRLSADWRLNRMLTRLNYRTHTDAVKEHLIPPAIPKKEESYIYADEADVLNRALFGKTAKQWKTENPDLTGNMRDYATVEQLLVLWNLESLNAYLIEKGFSRPERAVKLSEKARKDMQSILKSPHTKQIKALNPPSDSPNEAAP